MHTMFPSDRVRMASAAHAFALATIVLPTMASTAATAAPAASVVAADTQLNRYIVQHDVRAAGAMYAEHFVLTTSSGKLKTREDMLREIASPQLTLEINETSCVEVRTTNDTAILTGRLHQKGRYQGRPFDVSLLVTDTWIRVDGDWRLLAGHASVVPARADGASGCS
jgi:ketosteroid isomerase-like protein